MVGLLFGPVGAEDTQDIAIERVVGREIPGPYKHPATVCGRSLMG